MRKLLSLLLVGLFMLMAMVIVIPTAVKAHPGNSHYLVLDDAGCNPLAIGSDPNCWSATSGGAGGFGVPGPTDKALLDAASGAGLGSIDPDMTVLAWCMRTTCNGGTGTFTGTIILDSSARTLTISGAVGAEGFTLGGTFDLNGGTVTLNEVDWDSTVGTLLSNPVGSATSQVGIIRGSAGASAMALSGTEQFENVFLSGFGLTGDTMTVSGNLQATSTTISYIDVDFGTSDVTLRVPGATPWTAASFVFTQASGDNFRGSFTMDGFTILRSFDMTYTPADTTVDRTASVTAWQEYQHDPTRYQFLLAVPEPAGTVAFNYDVQQPSGTCVAYRNGVAVATDDVSNDGICSFTLSGGWTGSDTMLISGPGAGGPGSRPVPVLNWLPSNLPGAPYCQSGLTVVFSDTRREAANAVLWTWDFGDNLQQTTSETSVSHTYTVEGTYQVTVRAQDVSGRIDTFTGHIILSGSGCIVLNAAYIAGPYLLALLILVAFAIGLQIVTGRRKGFRRPLAVVFIVVVAIIAVFIYYGWPLELPGHIKLA